MRKYYLSFLSFFLFLGFGCSSYKEIQCTSVRGFQVKKINTEGIDAEILLAIKNPNKIGFTIYESELDIKYSGINLGKARLLKRVHIRGKSEETYSFSINNDFKNVNLLELLKLVSTINFSNAFEVKGDLRVGKFFIKGKVPIYLSEKVVSP